MTFQRIHIPTHHGRLRLRPARALVVAIVGFLAAVMVNSCQTTRGIDTRAIGRYTNPDTGEFIEFKDSRAFFYALKLDQHPISLSKGHQPRFDPKRPYRGVYKFVMNGRIQLSVDSEHLGLFKVEFSHDRSYLIVKHRLSGKQATFYRTDNGAATPTTGNRR